MSVLATGVFSAAGFCARVSPIPTAQVASASSPPRACALPRRLPGGTRAATMPTNCARARHFANTRAMFLSLRQVAGPRCAGLSGSTHGSLAATGLSPGCWAWSSGGVCASSKAGWRPASPPPGFEPGSFYRGRSRAGSVHQFKTGLVAAWIEFHPALLHERGQQFTQACHQVRFTAQLVGSMLLHGAHTEFLDIPGDDA